MSKTTSYSTNKPSGYTASMPVPDLELLQRNNVSDSMMLCSLLSLGCIFGFAPPPSHATLTALRALKIAQRRLRPEVRAKLLGVSSAPTGESLVPEAWRFTFVDALTSGNCRVVTVAAKTSSEHPDTIEAFDGFHAEKDTPSHVISQSKLTIDSDKALELARDIAKLKGVCTAEYGLIQNRSGEEPLWKIHFFAQSGQSAALVQIGTKTGHAELIS